MFGGRFFLFYILFRRVLEAVGNVMLTAPFARADFLTVQAITIYSGVQDLDITGLTN